MKDLKNLSILLIEDQKDLRSEMAAFMELYGARVLQACNGREALALSENETPDIVVSDIRMPLIDGLEMGARLRERFPEIPLIYCTAFTDTAYLLKAIELGAAAFVRKPLDTDELLGVISKAAVPALQRREIEALRHELSASVTSQLAAPGLQSINGIAARVAPTSFSVLLQGETGSGKSRLASIIHNLSPRRESPFITVQMGAMPLHLAESELFGHIKGAFTGATQAKTGLVETANGGTLFLDDVESCPVELQAKLLRFVEEKKYKPVGGAAEKMVDVRVISASNRNLLEEAKEGRFRQDLYYRLADVTIPIPPLREAPEAVVPLTLKFLRETCDELGRDLPLLDDDASALLTANHWPGNIRQLKSVIRRVLLTCGAEVTAADVAAATSDSGSAAGLIPAVAASSWASPPPFPCSMDALEKWALEQALEYCDGKRMKTATMLGMNYYTFRRRLEKHGIAAGD